MGSEQVADILKKEDVVYCRLDVINGTHLIDYFGHVRQIETTVRTRWPTEIDSKELENRITEAVSNFVKFMKQPQSRWMLLIVLCPFSPDRLIPYEVKCACERSKNHPETVSVLLHHGIRSFGCAKDSRWIQEREGLETLLENFERPLNEIILFDNFGSTKPITEGLQSNFYALTKDGVVVTAPDSIVVPGCMRSYVLEACKAISIPVEFRCPSASDVKQFRSIFISSTSRHVKQITKLFIQNDQNPFLFPIDEVVSKISQRVDEAVASSAVDALTL